MCVWCYSFCRPQTDSQTDAYILPEGGALSFRMPPGADFSAYAMQREEVVEKE
jgi:hypothetical protein